MGQSNWEADKMLDIYIHNYLLKRNLQATAKSFMSEAKVSMDPVAIDVPRGFLFEWWSVFWDIFIARTNDKHSELASSYIEAQQMKLKEQQHQRQLQMQQYQVMPQRHHPLHQSAASVLTGNIYEGCAKNSASLDSGASTQLLDARMDLLKSTTNLPGKLCQGNLGNLSVALQEITGDLGDSHRSVTLDPSTLYGQEIMQSKSGMVAMSNGLGQGFNNLPMKGWPLTGIDQLSRNFGTKAQRPLSANQFPLLSPQHQALIQVQSQGNLGNPSIGSPMHSGSPMVARQDPEHLVKIQQSSTQKWLDQLQQQQQLQQQSHLQQSSRKRKQPTSGPTNSTGAGNTVGPLTPPPMTPTHAMNDGILMAGEFPHVRSNSKNMEMCGPHGMGRRASSLNHLDELEHFGDIASLDKIEESYLSHDDGAATDLFATLKKGPAEQSFTFSEAGFIRTNDNKVVCCDFSSDGKFLASAGHEKKVVVWNMDTLETWRSKEEHSSIITDLCFRPQTTQLATSSFDATVQLWDAAAPGYKLHTYTGHNSHVTALDFHPKKTDLFCSCDVNGELRFWSSNPPYECSRVLKDSLEAKLQVRFQPRAGQLLALASETVVSILDVETDKKITTIPGHNNELHSICWHANGDYLAVVSQDSVKVWSLASGKCIHELTFKGNKFRSCVFHSGYTDLLIVGGYQTLQLWNLAENRTMAVQAHTDLIAALAHSSRGILASASHDSYVKIWK